MAKRQTQHYALFDRLYANASIQQIVSWPHTVCKVGNTVRNITPANTDVPVYFECPTVVTDARVKTAPTDLIPNYHAFEVCLQARASTTQVIKPDSIEVRVVDFSFEEANQSKHSFLTRPEHKTLFGTPRGENTPRTGRTPRQPPLPPPPEASERSLVQRLRWLLTPPIQELLRDPQLSLPHEPFEYQMIGIKWLMDREYALLADEMGIGKTMQAIIAARLLWRNMQIKRLLIICPKTLIQNWRDEIRQWWPAADDNTMVLTENLQWHMRLATDNVTIQIVNYELLARQRELLEKETFSYDLIIIDEAQRIKNPKTSTARSVKAIKATRRWALTGTPLENSIGDVVSIFGFILPDLLKSDEAAIVRSCIQPYMLRRRSDEVLADLPVISALDIPIELTPRQRKAYDLAEREGIVALNERGDTVKVTHVFALIRKLTQICNFETKSGESAKLLRLAADLGEIVNSDRKALIFSQFVSPTYGLKRLETMLPRHCEANEPIAPLMMYGKVSASQRAENVTKFRTDPSKNIMLLNYTVGGTGLNLQVANYVYLFDRWWNPAIEDQAMKRVHRIGQKHKVFVRRFVSLRTIEERIIAKIAQKRQLFDKVIDSDRPTPEAMGMSEEEVFQLFEGLKVRPSRSSTDAGPVPLRLDGLSPADFEELTARIYEEQGFAVKRCGGSNDKGIDLIATKRGNDLSKTSLVAVQCKHYRKKPVGPAFVRELVGVLVEGGHFHRADLVASSEFTSAAKQAAHGHRIELIDGHEFRQLARKYGVAEFYD